MWRKAHEFVLTVYTFTATFPRHEVYGLSQQMRRAAVSIPANIAEDLGYGDTSQMAAQLEEVSKMRNAYSTAILSSVFCLLTSVSYIPKGYQARSPCPHSGQNFTSPSHCAPHCVQNRFAFA